MCEDIDLEVFGFSCRRMGRCIFLTYWYIVKIFLSNICVYILITYTRICLYFWICLYYVSSFQYVVTKQLHFFSACARVCHVSSLNSFATIATALLQKRSYDQLERPSSFEFPHGRCLCVYACVSTRSHGMPAEAKQTFVQGSRSNPTQEENTSEEEVSRPRIATPAPLLAERWSSK